MSRLIVVCGATGQVGGSVARRMLKEGWKVRAVSRNQTSAAATTLRDAGAEVVSASYDDVGSLEAAVKDAHAIFAVTNGTFDNLLEVGPEAASEREYQEILNIATAASQNTSLEHLVLHTLPSGAKMAGKEFYVPHMDTKDKAADKIKETMPDLAKKTTFLWIGLFVSNFWSFPMMKPVELPNGWGSHAYIQPCKPDTHMYVSGNVDHNIGSFVNAILRNPDVSLPAKYAFVYTDAIPFKDMLAAWSEVTGKRATFVQCSLAEYELLWGGYGKELALQFAALEAQPDWTVAHKPDVITAKELGIPDSDLIGLKAALALDKEML
ncbi:hypothetical protein LTR36_007992 [Oleoguttula mirabilis]|uniref:NmrA-like domain-containing protein n=1 Tax=Oleoguttula mirabilis TaxID=1507867 RepID=A0AAV9J8X2_9PEZI|nr:hypothetical protein LTR36_007992 [Oleoguttula mirabilis]